MNLRKLCACAVLGIALALSPPPARADDETQGADQTTVKHDVCWRGRPLPDCRFFILTEFGVYVRLDDDPTRQSGDRGFITLDVGPMRNRTPKDAVGGTVYLASGASHARVGARARYRHWLSRSASFDFAPGIIAYGSEDGGYKHNFPGFVGGVTLNLADLAAVGLEVEHARYTSYSDALPNVSDTTWRAGGKLGSGLGLLGSAIFVGLVVAFVAATAD